VFSTSEVGTGRKKYTAVRRRGEDIDGMHAGETDTVRGAENTELAIVTRQKEKK